MGQRLGRRNLPCLPRLPGTQRECFDMAGRRVIRSPRRRGRATYWNGETALPATFSASLGLRWHTLLLRTTPKREWSEKAVQRKREWWQGHALLAVSCALLGEQDEARAAVGDWLLAIPGATVSNLPPIPFRNATDAERFRDGLRKAGLPE